MPADQPLLFYNGTFLSPHCAKPPCAALRVRSGRVEALENLPPDPSQLRQDGVQLIDLQGKTLLPAFNDAHVHVWKVGDLLTGMLDLRGIGSIAEMRERLADFGASRPWQPWIVARGFNEALFPDGRIPTRQDLDAALPERPCFVIRTCAHIAVANTAALAACGISRRTTAPPGGEIRLDSGGFPSGVLSETALGLVQKHLPPHSPDALRRMVLAAQDELLKTGIAAATDPAVLPDLLAVYRAMDAAGELKIRLNAIAIRLPDGIVTPEGSLPLPEPFESDFLKINAVKFFADGGISGKTAALKRPYRNSAERGVLRLDFDFFKKLALEAQAAGFQIATHAIGDAAIDLTLKVLEHLGRHNSAGLRHRIEHLGLPEPQHLERMRELGVRCVSQPVFLHELGRNFRRYLPGFYLENVFPYRSVLDAGVSLAFSSDAPVVKNFSPLLGIQTAVERRDAEGEVIGAGQRISAAEALRAYTLGAAEASGDERLGGSLEPGKRADFVVLEKNPLEADASDGGVSSIQVLETWVDGRRAFGC